jgi:hypothetical protein
LAKIDLTPLFPRDDTKDYKNKIELRLLRSRSFRDDLQAYGNFGILQRGPEKLLFKPVYTEDGRMKETQFVYLDERHPDSAEFRAELKKHETLFRTVWSRASKGEVVDLRPEPDATADRGA